MQLFTLGSGDWSVDVAGVLLDADGTLVDSTPVVEQQWRQFLEWYGLPASAFPDPLHGKRAEDHVRDLLRPDQVADAMARFTALEIADLDGIVAIPGAVAFVDALIAAGCPWAVVTSGTRPVSHARLVAAGFALPEVLVAAEDVVRGKPDPLPYLLGRQRLGLSDAGPVVAFEDAPAGIDSAHAAGCVVVALTSTHPAAELTSADLVLPDLLAMTVHR